MPSNEYFDNSAVEERFVEGEIARGTDVDAKLDSVQSGFDKLPTESDLKEGKVVLGVDSGTANAYIVAMTYSPTAYTEGLKVSFKVANGNTGPSTINIDGLGSKTIVRPNGSGLKEGDLPEGYIATMSYTGSEFRIETPLVNSTVEAENAASAAQVAQTAAESAQGLAESAKAAAELAEDNSETHSVNAQASAAAAAAAIGSLDTADLKSGRKNLLKGNFRINQRAVIGSVVLAAGEYGHDRFRAGMGGCTYTFSTADNVTTLTISAGTLEQVVEGLDVVSGDYVLSWVGTAQGRINGGLYGVSGAVSSSLVGGENVVIEFDAGTLALPQLEKGSSSTGFEVRGIGEELLLCQRYYEKSYNQNDAPGSLTQAGCLREQGTRNGNSSVNVGPRYAVVKREVPAVAIYSPSTGDLGKVFNGVDKTVSGIVDPGTSGFPSLTISSGDASNSALYHFTADAEI